MAGTREKTISVMRLPREVVYVYLAAPVVIQPIVNPDFFDEPFLELVSEIAGNYIPAVAIVLALLALYRTALPRWAAGIASRPLRLALHTMMCATAAMLASALVHPLHRRVLTDGEVPLLAYMQRNVGFTCLLVVPAIFLSEQRARARQAERRVFELRHTALVAELDALKARIEPHFLFNVLNTIASLVRDDVELAEKTVHRLSSILRYTLESTRADRVPLAQELEIVEAYLDVQRARFGDRLRYVLEIEPRIEDVLVPPLLLQPLVENAVLHGIAGRASGGRVRIVAARDASRIVLRVEDDGPGRFGSTHSGTGTSLTDLTRRVDLLFGPEGSVDTRDTEGGGFTVELRIPYAMEKG